MNIKLICLGIILFVLCHSCKGQPPSQNPSVNPPEFSKEQLLQHIKILSSDTYEGRRTGTEGGLKARQYIVDQFQKLDLAPLGAGYEQSFTFKSKNVNYNAANVLAQIKGTQFPDSYIVISAHYDHVGIKNGNIYNGADDDASGIGGLFGFAEFFKKNPPKHSVILAAFDSEELGLKGAKYFVDNPIIDQKSILLNINMDMISRSDKNELYVVGPNYYKKLKSVIDAAVIPDKLKLLMGHDGTDNKDNWTNSSDHAAFHNKEIPFLYFGVEDHKDYHKPTDDFENIHPDFYVKALQTIISVFQNIDNSK